jgi:hypothetical protein
LIKKRIKAAVLLKMPPFKNALLKRGGFVDTHWQRLYEQLGDLGNDDDLARELIFSEKNAVWRREVLSAARDLVAPGRLGHVSSKQAKTALQRGKTAPFTATIRIVDGEDANVVATGNFVWTLEQLRDGNDDFVPPLDVVACFPIGNMDLAMEYSLLEYNSILAVASSSYEYKNAMEVAAEVVEKYDLPSFPNFGEEFYKKILTFTRAEDIIAMCDLPPEDLNAKIEAFMDKNTDLKRGSIFLFSEVEAL